MTLKELSDPFATLSHWLRQRLVKAGWQHGMSRKRIRGYPLAARQKGYSEFAKIFTNEALACSSHPFSEEFEHVGEKLLDELFDLTLETDDSAEYRMKIRFSVRDALFAGDDIKDLSLLLKTQLLPIGEIVGEAFLLCGANSSLFVMGYVASGVAFLGSNFDEGMTVLLLGKQFDFMQFSKHQDPDDRFTFTKE